MDLYTMEMKIKLDQETQYDKEITEYLGDLEAELLDNHNFNVTIDDLNDIAEKYRNRVDNLKSIVAMQSAEISKLKKSITELKAE